MLETTEEYMIKVSESYKRLGSLQRAAEEAVKELTMLLMYLTRFHKEDRLIDTYDMTWKGYDFDIINKLDDEGYIRQGSHKS